MMLIVVERLRLVRLVVLVVLRGLAAAPADGGAPCICREGSDAAVDHAGAVLCEGMTVVGGSYEFGGALPVESLEVWNADDGLQRCTAAFQFSSGAFQKVPADTARTVTVALCGAQSDGGESDVTKMNGGITYHVYPQCNDGTYIYACAWRDGVAPPDIVDWNHDAYGVWRTADGQDWQAVSTTFHAKNVWYLSDFGLLLGARRQGGYGDTLWWSDDEGATWTQCTLDSEPFALAFGYWRGWELVQGNNRVFISTGAVNGPRFYRSGDGKAFTTVYVHARGDMSGGRYNFHHHSGVWVNGDTYLMTIGDSANQAVVKTTDGGDHWTDLRVTYGQPGHQCVGLISLLSDTDERLPSYVLGADDQRSAGVCLVNTTTGRRRAIEGWPQDRRNGYMFSLARDGGVYYAWSFDSTGSLAPAALFVSSDALHWTCYWQSAWDEGGPLRFAGRMGGRLYWGKTGRRFDSPRIISVSAAQVENVPALLLEPGAENLIKDQHSNMTELSGLQWYTTGDESLEAEDPPYSAYYLRGDYTGASSFAGDCTLNTDERVYGDDLGTLRSCYDRAVYSFSVAYAGRFRTGNLYPQYRYDGHWGNAYDSLYYVTDAENWMVCDFPSYEVPDVLNEGQDDELRQMRHHFHLYPYYTADDAAQKVTFDVDCAMLILDGPISTWHDPTNNGGVRADERIAWTRDLAGEWTLSLTAYIRSPRAALDAFGGGESLFHLISVRNSAGDRRMEVYYDPGDARLKLAYDDGGGFWVLCESETLAWTDEWHPFHLVIRAERSATKLSLSYGTGVLHYVSATPMSDLLGIASAVIQNGDGSDHGSNPTNQLPMYLADVKLAGMSLTDAPAAALMRGALLGARGGR